MKPTEGILYLVSGTVKCAEKEKPEFVYIGKFNPDDASQESEHNEALKSWTENLKDVVNVKSIKYRTHTVWYCTHDKGMTEIIFPQKCLFIPEDEGVRIIELK